MDEDNWKNPNDTYDTSTVTLANLLEDKNEKETKKQQDQI